ncbi:unnamed protein product [Absidia cylindrospora]
MKQPSSAEGSSKAGKLLSQTKASAISKQVLKSNPIPQQLLNKNLSTASLLKPKGHPLRSSKVSQKLVLFPPSSTELQDVLGSLQKYQDTLPFTSTLHNTHIQPTDYGIQLGSANEGEAYHPTSTSDADFWRPHHATGVVLPTEWTFESRTNAERMSRDERDLAQLPRVAAYCTGEGYNLTRLRHFLRHSHHVSPRQYDEALYAAYHFPLMTLRPDNKNCFRVRSASPRRSEHRQQNLLGDNHSKRHSLERSAISRQRRENEESDMNYDEDHMDQEGTPIAVDSIPPRPGYPFPTPHRPQPYQHVTVLDDDELQQQQQPVPPTYDTKPDVHFGGQYQGENNQLYVGQADDTEPRQDENHGQQQQQQEDIPHRKPFTGGEVFVFDYGVVVFWNFRRTEELLMLEDLADYSIRPFRDNPDEDIQIEEMHFQYDTSQLKPRIFNDMITMKTGNHMIKLTLSHGLSQSAVLARYEDRMDKTIEDTKYLPKEMAETGRLGKTRVEITTINGRLFNLRMNVNLVSNVLDTPEIFWSEPALQPMYNAIREYLEIPQRAKILNDRLRVISDLLSMLRDHLTNFGVEYQTLIIIYLIIIAVIVACVSVW